MLEEREGPEDEDDGQHHLEFSCCSPTFINGCWNLIRIFTLPDPIFAIKNSYRVQFYE
jgi:hypothetical protein